MRNITDKQKIIKQAFDEWKNDKMQIEKQQTFIRAFYKAKNDKQIIVCEPSFEQWRKICLFPQKRKNDNPQNPPDLSILDQKEQAEKQMINDSMF